MIHCSKLTHFRSFPVLPSNVKATLRTLRLMNNLITTIVSDGLHSLRYFLISNNKIATIKPEDVMGFTSLSYFLVSGNLLTEVSCRLVALCVVCTKSNEIITFLSDMQIIWEPENPIAACLSVDLSFVCLCLWNHFSLCFRCLMWQTLVHTLCISHWEAMTFHFWTQPGCLIWTAFTKLD